MEMCDVHDESGTRTGRIVARNTPLGQGEYYLSVQVWLRNEDGDYLIQQRAHHLTTGPGMWATTAGYVISGEDSVTGAMREVIEELGIALTPAALSQLLSLKKDDRIEHVWLANVQKNAITAMTLEKDVAAWQWASKALIRQMIEAGEFFGYSYFESLPE